MQIDGKIKSAMIGAGNRGKTVAQEHLVNSPSTRLLVVCDPCFEGYAAIADIFRQAGRDVPAYERDLERMVQIWGPDLDMIYDASPPLFHPDNAIISMEAGLHIIQEKPMSLTVKQASDVIAASDRTGKIYSVAYQANFSPAFEEASWLIRSGKLGRVLKISVEIHQNWLDLHSDEWRVESRLAGGGHLFDTGSHAINAINVLAPEELASVSAIFDNYGGSVEVNASVMGSLTSGIQVTISACGNTIPSCASEVKVYCSDGIIRTTVWGDSLEILREQPEEWRLTASSQEQGWTPVHLRESPGMWEEFVLHLKGLRENPSPPQLGLKAAEVWESIKNSASNGGAKVLLK